MTTPPTLVVDLDGTLLRSDLLLESFWSALARRWSTAFSAPLALLQGRGALKAHLAAHADIDVARLPYDDGVLEHLRAWRAQGGRCALVTASDAGLAGRVADHLGLFDEVHGSTPQRNLKGARKAAFLHERFGVGGYVYAGDSPADLPVWAGAAGAVTVTPDAGLRRRVEGLMAEGTTPDGSARTVTHLPAARPAAKAHLRALRPHQWLKNLLVFLPILTSQQFDPQTLAQALVAFVAFSLVASGIYLLNDLLDLDADRAHPRKRARPLASGALPLLRGSLMLPLLLIVGLACAATLGGVFVLVLVTYLVVTTAYSLNLKRRVVIDICVLAALYTLRVLAGGAATGIMPSVWLLAFSIFLFLALAAIKRQAELVDGAARGAEAAHGRGYRVEDIPVVMALAMSAGMVSVLVLVLYLNSPEVQVLYPMPEALWGIGLVLLYWITRIVMLTHRGWMHDDPVIFAVRDRISQLCGIAIIGFILLASLG